MQALHPTAMAAVVQHSTYRTNGWQRAMSIMAYELAVTYGSRALAQQRADGVRRMHATIDGTDPHNGRDYRADDEDLLLWVHAVGTLVLIRSHELFGSGFRDGEVDRFASV